MQRLFRAVLSMSLFLLPLVSWAERQYWVSVASYQDLEYAQEALAKANARLAEPFTAIGVETAKGYYYRVAAGPYPTRSIADEQVQAAQQAGFNSAWMWVDEAEAFANRLADEGLTDDAQAYDPATYNPAASSSLLDLDAELKRFEEEYGELDDYTPELNEDNAALRRDEAPELVEEAPSGYQLNRLHRSR